MNSQQIVKILALILMVHLSLFLQGCSDDDPETVCFRDSGRNIVARVDNASGTMVLNEVCGFVIEPDERLEGNVIGILGTCNLAEEFEIDGARIVFSGYIFESFEDEDICFDFFEVTDIRIVTE